jgi:PhoH-like ATPase
VVDTNVLLHDPAALFVFQEHEVIIPVTVIEELDRFKRDEGDRGRNARQCIRHLDRLRTLGKLTEGVRWGDACALDPQDWPVRVEDGEPTGVVRIEVNDFDRPAVIREDKADNRIIAVAWGLKQRFAPMGETVVFVSKDLNARLKADVMGIPAEDFENKKVDADKLYSGFVTLEVDGELIDELYRDRLLPLARLGPVPVTGADGRATRGLYANEFVVLRDGGDENHTGIGRRLGDTDHLIPVTAPRKATFGILPRNLQQTMALDLLLDEEVRMVTLMGGAGTGKTLVAVAAGMAKVFNEERYDKLLVARPIMPMGRDIGYLPGSKDDKLGAWMQPIFDNVGYLLSNRSGPMQHAESKSTEQRVQSLIDTGKMVMEPLTYIRGRSIPHQYMIVDEAQNLTPHEIKTIVSRIGEGTKIVLTGDVQQIDNPYLDAASNGLAYAIERMKGLRIVGHVTLAKSERSELASLAASLL